MDIEGFVHPEALLNERVLEGSEREKFIADLEEYIVGLEAAMADPDLSEEERPELQEQLDGLKDSYEAAQAGGAVKVRE